MDHIGLGPIIHSLLNLQDNHVSTTIWNGGEITFRARYNLWPQVPAEPVLQVIRNTAFGKILDIGRAEINNHLIIALVEHWRPETHTFHLPIGECTVTLEDVAYQLGLPIDRDVVTGPTNMDWNVVCHNLLGAVPNERQIVGQRIQMSWLDSTFQQLPNDVTEIRIYRSRVPLICSAIVEWHDADRVMRQFGLQQPIPQDPINWQKQHKMDLRGKNDYNWQQKHDQWIQIWNHREDYVMNGLPSVQPLHHYSQYMQWYLQMTRKYISPDGAYSSGSYNFIRSIGDQCAPSNVLDNPMQTIHGVYLQCNEMMDAFAKLLLTSFSDNNYQAPPTNQFDMPVAPEFQQPFESQTQTDTHPHAFTQQTSVPQQQPF
ncbi:hypothetical protein Lal_00049902 [Lupinus albus]|nr:hypothetical protein Lal_00049902 [Lupinus albus]